MALKVANSRNNADLNTLASKALKGLLNPKQEQNAKSFSQQIVKSAAISQHLLPIWQCNRALIN